VCATRPSLVSPNIIANSNTLISFMLDNQDDVDAVAGFLVGGARDAHVKETLRKLPVGEALVQLTIRDRGKPPGAGQGRRLRGGSFA